jgi:hypothetical protein
VGKVDKDKAAKTGDFLYRYMWTRHRCIGAPAPADAAWLAYLIEWGKKKFDNIHVEPDESPPIVWDNHHPAFFSAMVEIELRGHASTGRSRRVANLRPLQQPST